MRRLGLFAEPVGDLVSLDPVVLVEVDDRFHDHLGVGVGAPGPDLVGGDALAVVLHPGQVHTTTGPLPVLVLPVTAASERCT